MSEQNPSPTGSPNGVNGTSSPDDAATPPPSYDRVHADRRATGRAAFLEAFKNGEPTIEDKPATPAKSESPEPPEEDPDESGADEDADVDTESEAEEPVADEEPEPEPAAAKADEEPDADLSKRLEAVQQAKKRAMQEVAEAKVELDRRVATLEKEWSSSIDEAKRFSQLKARAKVDPVAALRALGIDGDDLDYAARLAHAEFKALKGDPAAKDQSAAAIRRRETETKLETMEREFREFKEEVAQREQAAAAKAYANTYLAKVEKAVNGEAPIVRKMMEKSPEKTLKRLGQMAYDLAAENDVEPTPAEVVRALEKLRREELEELGIAPPAPIKAAKPAAKGAPAKPNGAKPAAKPEAKSAPAKPLTGRAAREAAREAFLKGGAA